MQCSDSAAATSAYVRLHLARGYGTGSASRGSMILTDRLSAGASEPALTLAAGNALGLHEKYPALAQASQAVPADLPPTGPIVPAPETMPDALLGAATSLVTAALRQDANLPTDSAAKIAELVESTVLPLFDFRHMTQLAAARDWRLASPEQQNALIAEFRTLLVRTYSTALATYRDQVIEYKPLRMAPGETEATVKSTVKQPGAERMSIDYDMQKMKAGWKVYDIKIGGISLITSYRSTFAQIVRDGGVDSLIKSLAAKNRPPDSGPRSQDSGARPFAFMYSLMPRVFHSGQ